MKSVLAVLALCLALSGAFTTPGWPGRYSTQRAAKKGFGAEPKPKSEAAVGAPKPKSEAAVERDQAAQSYDKLVTNGVPEYSVFFRKQGEDGPWLSVGNVAVPRNEKVQAAIFGNIDALKGAAVRMHPQASEWYASNTTMLEYGYRYAQWPDEPVMIASPDAYQKEVEKQKNPVLRWMSALTNPLQTS
jgi:hypothetical protein